MNKIIEDNQKNLNSLNFFRGFAGYGVAVCHYYFYLFNIKYFEYLSIFFVEFFFILSGFVLTPQLIKIYEKKNNLKIFLYRRWMRTLPLFLLALAVYSFLFKKFDIDTIKYFLLIQNFIPNLINVDYFAISWSLAIEEYFYIIFPLIILLFKKNKFFLICLYFVISIFIINVLVLLFFNFDLHQLRINTFLRLDSIAYGVILRIYFNFINRNIIYFIIILLTFYFFYSYNKIIELNEINIFLFILNLKIYSVCFCVFFINLEKAFSKIKFIGILLANQTYSVYLFHLVFVYILKSYSLNSWYHIFLYLLMLQVFCSLIYYSFEKIINDNRPKLL